MSRSTLPGRRQAEACKLRRPRAAARALAVALTVLAALVLRPVTLHAGAAAPPAGIDPIELSVPAAGIDAAVQQVGLDADGSMGVPTNFEDAAWFADGYRPGEDGHAVLDGHVSSTDAAAVFYNVQDMEPGETIYVTGDDGSMLTFDVTDVESYPLDDTPLDTIFGASAQPELVLITCGGDWHPDVDLFDHRTVVYSTLVDDSAP